MQSLHTTTYNSEAMRVTVKLSLADETHRVTLDDHDALTFEALQALVARIFGIATPKAYALVYTDNEGDLVTVSSTAEVDEARRVLLSQHDTLSSNKTQSRPLHFRVVPRVSVKDQLPSAVLNAVDELSSTIARLASDTRESLAQSAYLERSRTAVASSAKHTRAFFDAAGRELSQRLRVVHACIAGEIERRRSSASDALVASPSEHEQSNTGHEMVVDAQHAQRTLYDASDSIADDASEHEGDSDDEVSTAGVALVEDREDEDTDDVPVLAAPAAPIETDAAYASDAETVASSDSDSDDDDDDDGWAVVPDVWSAEVALIRTIVPHVHVDDCVATLRKHGGDLEAAINELTDA